MHLPHDLSVVFVLSPELESVRLKILGHPRDVSLVENYLRSRIPELIETKETVIEREFIDPRPMMISKEKFDAKN